MFKKYEIAEIIDLPKTDFTFKKVENSYNFNLDIHFKHFDDWIGLYYKESTLSKLGRYILDKYKIDRLNPIIEGSYINIYLRGADHAILLYTYRYAIDKLVQAEADYTGPIPLLSGANIYE